MIDAPRGALVRRRAGNRCEYCLAHQNDLDYFTFHVEHVIPRQHGGSDDSDNLCLACPECNLAKGPNLTGLIAGKIVPLFHPRRQIWKRHFEPLGALIVGKTLTGKVTVELLNMNDSARLMVRESLEKEGRWPPVA